MRFTFYIDPAGVPVWECGLVTFVDDCFGKDFVNDARGTGAATDSGVFDAHVTVAVAVCSNQGCWRGHFSVDEQREYSTHRRKML